MKHFAALRREEAACQTFRPLLADELRFGAAVQCSNDDFDRLAILVLAEETGMHEGGVRNIQRVLRHGIERPRHLEPLPDGEVTGLIREGDLIGRRIRVDAGFGIDPHPTLRLATREGWDTARCVLGCAAQAGDRFAFACSVELPSVVVALDVPGDDAASGQGCVAMRAAIE
jgi:hypothetical protein